MTVETYQLILYTTPLELLTAGALVLFVLFFMLMIFFTIVVFFKTINDMYVSLYSNNIGKRTQVFGMVRSLGSSSHGFLVITTRTSGHMAMILIIPIRGCLVPPS